MVGYIGDSATGAVPYAGGDVNAYNRLVDAANAASTDDNMLNRGELEKFMETLVPGDISPDQTQRLINIYGNGDVVDERTIIEVMTTDGFLVAMPGEGGVTWSYHWDNIDGGLISDALCRSIGLEPGTPLTAVQFDEATDKLFGDTEGLNPQNAEFLARTFGTSGTLNRDQMAGIFERGDIHIDGVVTEGYIRVFVNYSETRVAFADNEQAASYIMGFDTNGDGWLNQAELQAAINSRLADGAGTDDEIMHMYMTFYGEKGGGGDMVVNRDGVMAMLTDTSLNLAPRGDEGANGFGINLHIAPVERVIRGASYADATSLNDGVMSEAELVVMFDQLGLDVTPEQAKFLLNVYGNGTFMNVTDIQRMRDDGFLTTGRIMIDPVTLNWDNIDGVLIARAVFWAAGVDPNIPGVTLAPDKFNSGVDTLFGDTQGQSLTHAEYETKIFGTNNTLTVDQMAEVFDKPGMHIDGVKGEDYVRILPQTDDLTLETAQASAYLMSFDADHDGILQTAEMETAFASLPAKGAVLNGDMVKRLSYLYSSVGVDGKSGFTQADLDAMVTEGVLLTAKGDAPGYYVDLAAVTNERLIDRIFRLAGEDPDTGTITAAEFDIGTDKIMGDWKPVREKSGKTIATTFGTTGQTDANGVSTMSLGDVANIFNSGVITRGGVDDRTFTPIILNLDRAREWIPLAEVKDPVETFSATPAENGLYYVTQRYSDGTVVRMEAARTGSHKSNYKYDVKSIQITSPNSANPSEPFTTTIIYDSATKTYSSLPGSNFVTVSLSNIIDTALLIYPDGTMKRFALGPDRLPIYNFHTPIHEGWVVSDRMPIVNDPADDVTVVSSQYVGSGNIRSMDGPTTYDKFDVTMSDGTVVSVYVHYSMFAGRDRNQQIAEQFATKFGRLPPQIQATMRSMKLGVEYSNLILPKSYGGYYYIGGNYMVIPQDTLNSSDAFFQGVVLHELGHGIDNDIPSTYWREAMNADGFSIGQYSTSNTAEDFAEVYYAWYMVRTGSVDPAAAAELERKFAHRFYLLDRSQSARATLPPENVPVVDLVKFFPSWRNNV